uniref:DDE-1 domain-containing protein n=1 Tax=Glossina brevipalpis TaxID=37001 RepID=A0A1A9X0E4_9MUSC
MSGKGAAGRITKNKKKTISLETKLDILGRFDKGEKAVERAKVVGLAATTVRTIRDRDRDKIREAEKSATSLDAKTMTRTKSALMIKMESLLSIWIENQVAHRIPLSKMVIQTKAKSLFDDIKSKAAVSNDNASEKSAPGFKASNDRLTLLLGGNANGYFKFKPFLIYQSENPRAMRGCSKNLLPVHRRANKKSWMTTSLLQNWVLTCAIPELKAYCNKELLNFKPLVLVDNAPGNSVYVDELSEHAKFVFL